MNLKQKFAAILALGVGALAVHAATPAPQAPANSRKEGPETEAAGEVEKADEAGGGQAGHTHTGDQADHNFDGEE
jgi:hypothetical protein